jgi:DNA invertase Pin-like site-specific DNA recombinase
MGRILLTIILLTVTRSHRCIGDNGLTNLASCDASEAFRLAQTQTKEPGRAAGLEKRFQSSDLTPPLPPSRPGFPEARLAVLLLCFSLHHCLTFVERWRKVVYRTTWGEHIMRHFIAYYRVSTRRQGQSGLGLDAQRAAVSAYVKANGGRIIAEYQEVESGKRHQNRPQLAAAIQHGRGAKATLVIAKLDRLARNVAFVSALMESACEFVACDNPNANKLTIHILAAVAEEEARAISDRTTKALAAAKRRGQRLGSARRGHWKGREHLRRKGSRIGLPLAVAAASEARRQRAADHYGYLMDSIRSQRAAGDSLSAIAAGLNDAGHVTTAGGPFTPTAVHRLLVRS